MEFISFIYVPIALSFIFISYYYYKLSTKSKSHHIQKTPPEAKGAWPFIGHLLLMRGGPSRKNLPHINLASLADKYGPIFTIRIGVHRTLVVSSPELVKELFTTCDVAVSSRPSMTATKHLSYDFAVFGFAPYGDYWRQMRKLVSVELLSSRRLELFSHVRVSEIEQSINDLYKLWENDTNSVVDMKKWVGDLNLNVLLRMVAGKKFFGDRGEAKWCREVLNDFFELAALFLVGDALPYLGWLDIGGYEKRMKKTAKELDMIVGEWLKEHKSKEHSNEANAKDFMDVMLSVLQDAEIGGPYDADTIIKATCGSLISGGSDTTAVALVWALSLLLNNRHVLKRVQEELDIHVGRDRRVNESDISNLIYLQAVVKETFRLYPAGPLGGPREFTEDAVVGGYHVPKGTWLFVNQWKLHRDPKIWQDDPLEFKPERFLSSHKNVDVKGQDFELIPFGAGRRMCPGMNFGLQMVHLTLANLLQAFDISTVLDEPVDMTENFGLANHKATPLDVLVAPRLDASLY